MTLLVRTRGSSGGSGGRVGEADDRLQTAILADRREVGPADVERSLGRPACRPAEAEVAVVRFDPADETKPVAREHVLRGLDHLVDGGVALAAAVGVDVAAALRPGPLDQLAPALAI